MPFEIVSADDLYTQLQVREKNIVSIINKGNEIYSEKLSKNNLNDLMFMNKNYTMIELYSLLSSYNAELCKVRNLLEFYSDNGIVSR